jgi:hypothetical protein
MTLSVVPVLLSAGKLAEGAEEVGSLDESEYYEACGLVRCIGTGLYEQPCTVVDRRDGSYAVRFVRQHAGLYQASAC